MIALARERTTHASTLRTSTCAVWSAPWKQLLVCDEPAAADEQHDREEFLVPATDLQVQKLDHLSGGFDE
jgi:hypothetical protein